MFFWNLRLWRYENRRVLECKPSEVWIWHWKAPGGFDQLYSECLLSYPRDPITETENGFMEPKYLSFRRWRWHPLLIIWRSVIGSLGLDIHHSERIDGDRHSQKVVKSFRGHDTRIYTNTWELRHRSSPGGILHCPLNMHGWIYIY